MAIIYHLFLKTVYGRDELSQKPPTGFRAKDWRWLTNLLGGRDSNDINEAADASEEVDET